MAVAVAQYDSLFEQETELQIEVHVDGRIRHINNAAVLGYATDALLEQHLEVLFIDRYHSSIRQLLQTLPNTTSTFQPQTLHSIARAKDGTQHTVLLIVKQAHTANEIDISMIFVAPSRQQLDRLQLVNEIALSANRLDLEQILEVVYQRLNRLMDIPFFFVGLYNVEKNQLQLRCVYDDGNRLPDYLLDLTGRASFSEWAIRNRQTLIIDDANNQPLDEYVQPYGIGTRSCVFIPLLVQDNVVGVLSAQSQHAYQFEVEEISMLEAIASQTAIAVHNAQLYSDARQRLTEMSMLRQFAEQLAMVDSITALADIVISHLAGLFSTAQCLYVWQSPSQPIMAKSNRSTGSTTLEQQPVLKQLLDVQTPINSADTSEAWVILRPTIRSFMAVPIVFSGPVTSCMVVGSNTVNAFGHHQLELLTVAATTIVATLRNIQLLQESRNRTAELEAAYAELQELNQLRQELVDNVSHELRSPLAYVRAYVGLMAVGELGDISKAQQDALRIIDRKTNGMLRLINDILEMEKIRPETLQRHAEDIRTLLQHSVQAAQMAHMTSDVKIELDEDIPAGSVYVDALRIEQVLSNLLSNAVKFSEAGQTVVVSCDQTHSTLWIRVKDQGPGIPTVKLDRIFERFYRVPGIKQEGIGIGLAIVRQIIMAHGGDVRVSSEVGKGTQFSVSLPL